MQKRLCSIVHADGILEASISFLLTSLLLFFPSLFPSFFHSLICPIKIWSTSLCQEASRAHNFLITIIIIIILLTILQYCEVLILPFFGDLRHNIWEIQKKKLFNKQENSFQMPFQELSFTTNNLFFFFSYNVFYVLPPYRI